VSYISFKHVRLCVCTSTKYIHKIMLFYVWYFSNLIILYNDKKNVGITFLNYNRSSLILDVVELKNELTD